MSDPIEFYRTFRTLLRERAAALAAATPDDLSPWPAELDGGVDRG